MTPTADQVAEYLRADLRAYADPMRQDKRRILEDLRFSFRSYRYLSRQPADWVGIK